MSNRSPEPLSEELEAKLIGAAMRIQASAYYVPAQADRDWQRREIAEALRDFAREILQFQEKERLFKIGQRISAQATAEALRSCHWLADDMRYCLKHGFYRLEGEIKCSPMNTYLPPGEPR